MEFALPGQLRGPECRRVITQAVALRRFLEQWFDSQPHCAINKFTIVLRVDGSLGSFGPEGVENVQFADREIVCDLVLADPIWDRLSEQQIATLLRQKVLAAIDECFKSQGIPFNRAELEAFVSSAT